MLHNTDSTTLLAISTVQKQNIGMGGKRHILPHFLPSLLEILVGQIPLCPHPLVPTPYYLDSCIDSNIIIIYVVPMNSPTTML